MPGGAGGGGLEIGASGGITIAGTIKANGYQGADSFGAGGGSGGGVFVHAPTVNLSGVINAGGGAGGSGSGFTQGGGGGGSGRVHVLTGPGGFFADPGLVVITSGGNGGAPNGGVGGSSGMVVGLLTRPGPAVTGCIQVSGTALAGIPVQIKQQNFKQQTVTDPNGCYAFSGAKADRKGTITIELPPLP